MHYRDREDYKTLIHNAKRAGSKSTVTCNPSPKGGVVVNVKTPVCAVRVWALEADDAFEAARCALQEAGPSW